MIPLSAAQRETVAAFHRLYYETVPTINYRGIPMMKCPFDLWRYQQVVSDTSPELVIETGTAYGGSAYFLADILSLGEGGRVVTVDVTAYKDVPAHPLVTYLVGSSTDSSIIEQVAVIAEGKRTMVILDSDHSREHVLKELDLYASLVTVGCYLIVEDTNLNGRPVRPDYGPGPYEAVTTFLERDGRFVLDRQCEDFLLTYQPGGWLKRVR